MPLKTDEPQGEDRDVMFNKKPGVFVFDPTDKPGSRPFQPMPQPKPKPAEPETLLPAKQDPER